MSCSKFIVVPERRRDSTGEPSRRSRRASSERQVRSELTRMPQMTKEMTSYIPAGRRLLKEDRSEAVYGLYKNAKARLKLIDALLSKKVDHFF